jgi:hypothetical protein
MVVHCPSSGQFFNIIARAGLGSGAGLAGAYVVPVTPAVEAERRPPARSTTSTRRRARKAEVKLADPAGGTVWACLIPADEILVTVPGSFIASQDEPGIGWFLSRRRG